MPPARTICSSKSQVLFIMTLRHALLVLLLGLPAISVWGTERRADVDPWEPLNRKVFVFNETLDEYVLLPTARGYRFVMPDPAEQGVSNFIANIGEFNSVANSLLQGRPGNALQSGTRFLVNSTVGLFGLFDVATPMGIEPSSADFDQTLHTWGVGSGPFLMLPLFGPNTVRSSAGLVVDTTYSIPALQDNNEWQKLFGAVQVIDVRASLIKADDLITGDRYIFMRNAYLQRREYYLSGGKVEDSFSDFDDPEEYEEF
jgi:phospholipid-binding lipoprotein MlaA